MLWKKQSDKYKVNGNEIYDWQDSKKCTGNYIQGNSPKIRSKNKNKENMWEMIGDEDHFERYCT